MVFTDKKVLDIGSGTGLFAFYAAVKGADLVTCLEPESDGSSEGMNNSFEAIKQKLKLNNIFLFKKKFQDYNQTDIKYDIVLLHNSINHLNENACKKIGHSIAANKIYLDLIKKIYGLMNSNGRLIICDCSNKNIFYLVGLKNPLAKNIDWETHQSPQRWIKIFEKAGFKKNSLRWNTPKYFGKFGNFLLGNKVVSFLTTSHFRVEFTKP
jgi:SAM-dependent methyltransferase